MIIVAKTDKSSGRVARVEIPEGKDVVAVLNAVLAGLGFKTATEDPLHDEIMAARKQRGSAVSTQPPKAEPPALELRQSESRQSVGVRETSRDAYRKAKWSGKLTRQQEQIVAWFRGRAGDATRQEIARGTGLGINCVTGRVNELLNPEIGVLREVGKRKCRVTGETANGLVLV